MWPGSTRNVRPKTRKSWTCKFREGPGGTSRGTFGLLSFFGHRALPCQHPLPFFPPTLPSSWTAPDAGRRPEVCPAAKGTRRASRAAKAIVTECRKLGIPHLTLYTFSQENWGRPRDEVALLFQLLVSFLGQELPGMLENDIRLCVLGDLAGLPLAARTALGHALKKTEHCSSMTVNLALNYSGREEILRAVRALLARGIPPDELTEERFAAELYTTGQPDPDLIIRTSGEDRLSQLSLSTQSA